MNKSFQMPLPLTYRKAYDREDFLVAECNQDALKWLDAYPAWPYPMVLLMGPEACGKTHLASVFTQNIFNAKDIQFDDVPNLPDTFVLEDIDTPKVDETNLFHLFNDVMQKDKRVLMTARAMPFWKLPDLKTRMSTIPVIKIGQPDDLVMMSLILKGFTEQELDIESGVIDYILKHLERSFAAIQKFVEVTGRLSLATRRRVTIPLAKEAMDEMKRETLI